MAIPDASLPGYASLAARVREELGLLREGPAVEYKRSAPWDTLRWKILRTCLAMANLREGGLIIIGVSEGPAWAVDGMTPEDLETFDVDEMQAAVDKFSSRPIQLEVVTVQVGNARLLVVAVPAFSRAPVICRRSTPDGVVDSDRLENGAIYVRPAGLARTERIRSADQMSELVEMAAEVRAGELLAQRERLDGTAAALLRQLGFGTPERQTDDEAFQRERGDL